MANNQYPEVEPSNLPKETVHKLAESVAEQLGYKPRGDLKAIIVTLGGEIHYKDFWQSDDTDSGSIYIDGERNFRIFLADHTTEARDRFTIAHELGHYVLHFLWPNSRGADLKHAMAKRYGSDRAEWEANWFAAGFLMPAKAFQSAYRRNSGSCTAMAREFGVSVRAAEVRAEALRLET